MSILHDQLRSIGIVNTWDVLMRFAAKKGEDVAIQFHSSHRQVSQTRGARVWSTSHQTDPDAHWTDHGQKSFPGHRKDAMAAAIDWATTKYRIKEWSVDPTNPKSMIPTVVRKRLLPHLKLKLATANAAKEGTP